MGYNQMQAFIASAGQDELYDLLALIKNRLEARARQTFPESVRAALGAASIDVREVRRVDFGTMSFDNGFYFYEVATVHLADGTSDQVDLSGKLPSFEDELTEMSAVVRREYGTLDERNKLTVAFPDGEISY